VSGLSPEAHASCAGAPGGAPAVNPGRPAPQAHCLLLSGGLDSATLAAWIKEHHPGEPITAYTFLYGQKHAVELQAASAVAEFYGLEHYVRELEPIRGSALTDSGTPMPVGRDLADAPGVAPTYVPARNLFFLAQVATLQDAKGPAVIWLGVHHDDYAGYPDCRPEFIEAANTAVRLGTQYQLRVEAPFVHYSKTEIVRWGLVRGVPYGLTHSCYQGRRPACGVCDTCQGRLAAFAEAGVADPLPYESHGGAAGGAFAGRPDGAAAPPVLLGDRS
jgi:7-cyano-7-deazaguanine synthase